MKVSDIDRSLSEYKVVKGPRFSGQKFDNSDKKQCIKIALMAALGHLNLAMSASLAAGEIANILWRQVNFDKIGGIYTLNYYVKIPYRKEHRGKNINVPVPHEFFFVTFVLDDTPPKNANVVYTEWKSDGIRLANIN
ncbi:hypothetical protein [Clostridium tetani]|uniref:Uncharacterized protein n=1 Tax=Clostridium tetani (strain Massachusetts / E88) TaxID=212717 RepID=Q89A11_CLOTE|nr:hypothetical protein [Clostridium tetani]AAO37399.1 hypothetical protein CTC_p2 [Clostridium tetani E88]KGI36649.1 hypothetical protein KY52_13065 [Clostridium tetani]KGI42918.1 hypothetical protein KY55_08360 [Clostridium tetani]KHO30808.1 hypothetical protein OR63_13580 [Clostridium tetani]KIG19856.1 hypothetical protein RS78_12685 [Clostridium tetani]